MDLTDSRLGLPKRVIPQKVKKGLSKKTPLKSHYEPIPTAIKKAVLEQKGSLCLLGYCEVCGGQYECSINDDFHHKPKRSHGGKDIVDHLYPARRDCHSYYEDHPVEEKEIFKRMEAAGIKVIWKVEGKGMGVMQKCV